MSTDQSQFAEGLVPAESAAAGACGAAGPGWNESDRLAALDRYEILDTPREPEFDDVARLAADIFDAPIAVVNLIAEGRQWFKAEVGIGADELPLDVSICAHAILQPGIFVVPDTTADLRFSNNPLVTGEPGLRFYAGALLETPDGLPLGTVCVLDTKVRPQGINGRQRLTLEVLARQVMTQLELRRAVAQRERRANELRSEIETRREMGVALQDTTRRLDAVLNNTRMAVFLMDHRQHCVYANASAETLTGYRFEQMSGRALHDIVHHTKPDGSPYPLHECPIDRAFPERAQMSGEELFVAPDGSLYPVAFTASPVVDDESCPIGTVIEARNIAEEKARGAALRESEARLAFLDRLGAETAPLADADAVLATTTRRLGEHLNLSVCAYADMDEDQDGFTIRGDWASPGSTSIIGHYSLADFGQLAVKNLSAGLPLVINDNLRELAPEEAATFQTIGIAATICMPLVKEGRLTALMAIHDRVPRVWTEAELSLLREVTARSWAHVERVAAVAEVRASEARLRELNDTLEAQVEERTADRDRMWRLSTDIMLVSRFDGTINSVNPAWTALLGWSQTELVGANFMELVHPEDQASTLSEMGRLGEGATTFRFENRYRAKDGSYRWLSWTAVPGGNHVHAVGRDITIEKERRAELESAQEALRQAQKMEAMGQLTGGVAHDFNNLLTPIVGSLDMLVRRGLGSERERRLIDGALQSAERAKTLVQRLLAFARRQPLQPQAVDLKRLVGGMADLISSTSGPNVQVRVDLPNDLPPATADANQVEMAVLNLAVNARDAMPNGGILTISAVRASVRPDRRSSLPRGHYVRLSVSDTGIGMDEETLARAVEPFFSTKGIGKGTGLGLSMVHGLALQLGGELTINSKPGQGTTVNLWLPISAHEVERDERVVDLPPASRGLGMALLVDDEDLVRMSTADMLMDLGYDVAEASSAEEALRLLDEGLRPDLLVTDHLMPGMNGAELAQLVATRRPELPVLIVSGYAEAEGVAPGLARLTKPFRNSELASSLAGLTASKAF
jgi:PAS domain S-box-containing protein